MGARILVIEDNPDNLELMTLLLESFGHRALTAVDGVQGIELARRERPDLVLCDIHLPGKDGYAVARELGSDPAFAGIPLLAVTALAMAGDREKGLAAGFHGYIYKPIDPKLFVSQIESYLRVEQRGVAPVPCEDTPEPVEADKRFKASVLVVDDSKINRDLIQETLAPFGYDVRVAHSVQKAIEMARSATPDLILSDLHMPDEDGFNLIRLIKADTALASVPFVFISSSVWGERDRETALQLGVTRFLLRPIEPSALIQELEGCLAARETIRRQTTILVVDDRAINREFLSNLLDDAGYKTVPAADGMIALEMVRARRPDLIITDVLMPRMGGVEFADRVRSDPQVARTPIIFYTATYKLSEVRDLAASCGVSAILAKPSEPQIILDAVRTALGCDPAPNADAAQADLRHVDLGGRLRKVAGNDLLQGGRIGRLVADSSVTAPQPSQALAGQYSSHTLTLRLATFLEFDLALTAQADVREMLQLFCHAAQDIMKCKYVAIGILDATGHRLERFESSGVDDGVKAQYTSIDPLAGVFARVNTSRTPYQARNESGAPTTLGLPAFHPPIDSLLLVPVPTRSTTTVCGWVYFADRIGKDEFDDEDQEFAVTLAAKIALAYGNLAQYEEIQHHAAQLEAEVAKRRRAQEDLSHRLTHDQVTGLPRFVLVESALQAAFAEAAANEGRVIVLYVDIDRFHMINEVRGRSVGDLVLCAIAHRLRVIAGDQGWVAHVAGDEFLAAIIDANSAKDQLECAEEARRALEEPIVYDGERVYATCSIGVSCFPDNGASAQELLRQSEAAMLRAKRETRNAVSVFSNEQKHELADRIALGLRLKDAIRDGQLFAHYQPIISGQDWQVLGFEALVRWQHPERGLLLPGQFLKVAEDLGLIVDIGGLMMESSCRQARAWYDMGARDFFISVNVSALQLYRPSFVDELRATIAGWELPSGYIELELTENVIVRNVDQVLDTMRAMKTLGVKISLDDFGTGYSSLNYLRQFPIDKLKIDLSLIKDITSDPASAGICRAITSLGHQLGMSVLAEGVETAAQVAYLLRNDCDSFQGYYFGRPVIASKAFDFLSHRYVTQDLAIVAPDAQTLLLVDDEENILAALTRLLRRDGYRILTATEAKHAFELLAANEVKVIISDQRMPNTTGTEFLSQVKQMYPETVRMVLSGYTDLNAVTEAINRGAIYKFLTKPWNDDELRMQIRDAFRIAKQQEKSKNPPLEG